jgi:hypothetical protein
MVILRDSIWQFIGAVLTLIAIIISVYVSRKQRERKHIHCEIISNSSVVSVSKPVKPDIQIFYKGKLASDLRLIIIKLQNTGTLPISSKDYEEPIQVFLGEDADILDVELVEFAPKSLAPQFNNNVNNLTLKPLLLNPKDMFILKVIARKASETVEVKARIIGVSDITKSVPSLPTSGMQAFPLVLILVIAFIGLGFFLSDSLNLRRDLISMQNQIQLIENEKQQLNSQEQQLNSLIATLEQQAPSLTITLTAQSIQVPAPSRTPSP